MTLYQVVYYVKKADWLESESGTSSRLTPSAKTIMGGQPGEVPKSSDIRALAKMINPDLVIPEN